MDISILYPPFCTHHCLLHPLKAVKYNKSQYHICFALTPSAIICLIERTLSPFTRCGCRNPTCNQSNSSCSNSCSNAQANDTIYNRGIETMSELLRAQIKSLLIGLNMIKGAENAWGDVNNCLEPFVIRSEIAVSSVNACLQSGAICRRKNRSNIYLVFEERTSKHCFRCFENTFSLVSFHLQTITLKKKIHNWIIQPPTYKVKIENIVRK